MDELRRIVTARRRALRLTQTEAGTACHPRIGQQAISKMESGLSDPGLAWFARYCRQGLGLALALKRL